MFEKAKQEPAQRFFGNDFSGALKYVFYCLYILQNRQIRYEFGGCNHQIRFFRVFYANFHSLNYYFRKK